jgi:hypothetical protein
MSNTFFGVAIDCAHARAVATFWAQVLERQVADHPTREHAAHQSARRLMSTR